MARKKADQTAITYKGKTYPLVFNLNVMEEIQREYGTVDKWGKLIESEEEPDAKAIKYGFTAMLNEGIDIQNEGSDEKLPFFTEKQVGRIITEIGLKETANALRTEVVQSTKSDEKNA